MYNFIADKEEIYSEEEWGSVFKVELSQGKYILAGYLLGKVVVFDKQSLKNWKIVQFEEIQFTSLNIVQLNANKIEFVFSVQNDSKK